MNGPGTINPTALKEVVTHGQSRTLGCNKNHINVLWWDNSSLLMIDNSKAMREIQGFAWSQIRQNSGPQRGTFLPKHGDAKKQGGSLSDFLLSSIRNQELHNGALVRSLLNVEQVLPGHPAIPDCCIITLSFLDTNDDFET